MFPFVKHLRCFVFQAVAGDFRPFRTLMFPNVSQESGRSGQSRGRQGVQPGRLLPGQGHLAGQLPVYVHGELDVAVAHAGLDQLRMRRRLHVQSK